MYVSVFQKEDPKALQQDLNLLWMYNLQWHFLEAKAKKQLKDQEKQAMVSIANKLCLIFSQLDSEMRDNVVDCGCVVSLTLCAKLIHYLVAQERTASS